MRLDDLGELHRARTSRPSPRTPQPPPDQAQSGRSAALMPGNRELQRIGNPLDGLAENDGIRARSRAGPAPGASRSAASRCPSPAMSRSSLDNGSAETRDADHILGAAAAVRAPGRRRNREPQRKCSRSLPGPARRRPSGRRSCAPKAPEDRRPALDIQGNFPQRLDRIDMQQAARRMRPARPPRAPAG